MTQKERYNNALESFTNQIKEDPNVIALLLFGSLAYYDVWEQSNMDIELIVRDGSSPAAGYIRVDEDGINLDVSIAEVTKFKTEYQQRRGGEFMHSLVSMGKIVFTKDETIREFFEDVRRIGSDDAARSFRGRMRGLLNYVRKADKWISLYDNPLYAQRFLHQCCVTVAEMELLTHCEVPKRESILRAQELNPALMHELYVVPSTKAMSVADVRHAFSVIDNFLTLHMPWWSEPILRFLGDGEIKTVSQIYKQCGYCDMDFLVRKGVVGRAALPSRMFKRSKLTVEEVSYYLV
ncbi:MAG: hypothetical protein FWC32_04035 [Firmicutes bacterium]|nr:hypothetical protein [Bacillota bacterium]